MLYKFKSKATGDLIMLGPHGDQLLRLLGREPAGKGIIEPGAMADAMRRLRAAVAEAEAAGADATSADATSAGAAEGESFEAAAERRVGLRQRLWPMLEMLQRAERAAEPIVWGV